MSKKSSAKPPKRTSKPLGKKAQRVRSKPTGLQSSFPPTLGELDLHLFAEGRHEAIYEKLGAHVRKLDRVTGVSFAVWAPHAEE